MNNEMTLKEMLGILCKKWRILLIIALFGGLILGSMQMYKLWDAFLSGGNSSIGLADDLEYMEYQTRKENLENRIFTLNKAINSAESYLERNPIMELNTYNIYASTMSFCIKAADTDDENDADGLITQNILSCYTEILRNCDLKDVFKGMEWEKTDNEYLHDIVSIKEIGIGIIRITVIGKESKLPAMATEKIYKYLVSKQRYVLSMTNPHSIEVLNRGDYIYADDNLYQLQLSKREAPLTFMRDLQTCMKELDGLEYPTTASSPSRLNTLKSVVKYGVLGLAVGVCFGVLFVFLYGAMGMNVTGGANLARALECRYLGNISDIKRLKGLDALGEKLCGEDVYASVAYEDRLKLLGANLSEAIGDKKALLLVGIQPEDVLSEIADKLTAFLQNGTIILASENLLVNIQAIQNLNCAEGVVFAINANKVRMERTLLDMQRVREAGKELLGIFLV